MSGRSQAWIRQAHSDLEAARCTAEQGFHAQACCPAGQAAEKALKALLWAEGVMPPTSHSLERIVELLQQEGFNLNALRDSDLALTTAQAVVQIANAELTS